MKELKVIRRWLKESIDPDYYNLIYSLFLSMSGDFEAMQAAVDGKVITGAWQSAGGELAVFPEISPGIGPKGLQNHQIVNSRINIQGLNMNPDFEFGHPDQVIRQWCSAFFSKRWTEGKWGQHTYRCGLELEAAGIAAVKYGVSEGRITLRHQPILDTLWDRSASMPDQWRWVCTRDRLTPEQCQETYPNLTDEDIKKLTRQEPTLERSRPRQTIGVTPAEQIVEWCYYDKEHHVVFLGSIDGENVILAPDEDGDYHKAAEAGPNLLGIIPVRFWIDSWAPSVKRPVGKAETTIRLNSMLNEVEMCLVKCVENGMTMIGVDVAKIQGEDAEEIKQQILNAKSWKSISTILALKNVEDIRKLISRLEPMGVPQTLLALRSILKEEINASTGVQDMMRGQALAGERTKGELDYLVDQSGIQGRHLKQSWAEFGEGIVWDLRAIAARFDQGDAHITLPDYGVVPATVQVVHAFLSINSTVIMSPDSISHKTERERRMATMQVFTTVLLPGMADARSQLDPAKCYEWTLRRLGIRDPRAELMMAPPALPGTMGGPPGMPPGVPAPQLPSGVGAPAA